MVLSFIFYSYISHSVVFLFVDNHSRVDLSSIRIWLQYWPVRTLHCPFVSFFLFVWKGKRKIVNHLFTCCLFQYSKRQKKDRLSFSFSFPFFFFLSHFFWHVRTMNACHYSRVMYSSVLVCSASSLLSVPREIKKNDNGDDDDEKKTAVVG